MRGNCTSKVLLELISDCPNLIEKLYKKGRLDLIEAYDMVMGDYNMSFGTLPPYSEGESWGYYYCEAGEKHVVDNGLCSRQRPKHKWKQ